MYQVQCVAACGFTTWVRVKARGEASAASAAVKVAAEQNPSRSNFQPGAVLAW